MTVITNAANILEECFYPTSHSQRILIDGDVPIGKAARISLMTMEDSEENDLVQKLKLENETLQKSVNVKHGYRWIVRLAVSLTSLAFIVMIFLTFQGEMSEQHDRLFEICDTTWKIGFAAIIGLIGGKIS